MYRSRLKKTFALVTTVSLLGFSTAAGAAVFQQGVDPSVPTDDPMGTPVFTGTLLDDVTASGGGDSATVSSANLDRNLSITTGAAPQTLTIEGISFNLRGGTSTTEQTVSVEIIYFGNDGSFNSTADNVNVGTATATLTFVATDQYTAVFDTPLESTFVATDNRFRFNISSTGSLRFKTFTTSESPSGQGGVKVSVGGTSIPEPGSMALMGLGGLLILARRRNPAACISDLH